MAAVKTYRLRRFNSTDYDTVHLESASGVIIRPDGTSVETGLSNLESTKMDTKIKDDTLTNTYFKIGMENGEMYVQQVV